MKAVHDEVTGLRVATENKVQFPIILVHHPKRGVFFLATHVVVESLIVTSRFASTGVIANVYGGLAIHAQSLDLAIARLISILFLDVGKNGVRFRDFF